MNEKRLDFHLKIVTEFIITKKEHKKLPLNYHATLKFKLIPVYLESSGLPTSHFKKMST